MDAESSNRRGVQHKSSTSPAQVQHKSSRSEVAPNRTHHEVTFFCSLLLLSCCGGGGGRCGRVCCSRGLCLLRLRAENLCSSSTAPRAVCPSAASPPVRALRAASPAAAPLPPSCCPLLSVARHPAPLLSAATSPVRCAPSAPMCSSAYPARLMQFLCGVLCCRKAALRRLPLACAVVPASVPAYVPRLLHCPAPTPVAVRLRRNRRCRYSL